MKNSVSESGTSFSAKWLLLLIVAAAGLWLLWDRGGSGPSLPETVYDKAGSEGVRIIVEEQNSSVRAEGLSMQALRYLGNPDVFGKLQGVFSVYALPGNAAWDSTAIPADGSYSITERGIEFVCRHTWLPGVRYHVRLDGERLNRLLGITGQAEAGGIDTTFTISRPSGLEPERVTGVYPSADTLPQNLLKFYIHFSGPMTRGDVYSHISIRNAEGEIVPDAFLELPQELWDPDATRLTVLFDPGRIKRGLQRHNLMGVAFEPGRSYTLVVDTTLEDGNGLPLETSYRKTFTITEPDRRMPDHGEWEIIPPAAGTRQALELRLDEPLDRALLHRLITVVRDGEALSGTVKTSDSERAWQFVPNEPWTPGSYRLEIGVVLEDLASNNLISVFDVDLSEEQTEGEVSERPGPDSVITKRFDIR